MAYSGTWINHTIYTYLLTTEQTKQRKWTFLCHFSISPFSNNTLTALHPVSCIKCSKEKISFRLVQFSGNNAFRAFRLSSRLKKILFVTFQVVELQVIIMKFSGPTSS